MLYASTLKLNSLNGQYMNGLLLQYGNNEVLSNKLLYLSVGVKEYNT